MTPRERERKQAALILSLADGCTRSAACKAARVDRSTFYAWAKSDKRFGEQVEEALLAQIGVVEDALYAAAVAGDVKAMIHFLRCRAPDVWEPNRTSTVAVTGHVGTTAEAVDWEAVRDEMRKLAEDRMLELPTPPHDER